jgi:accessory colonization factor AcfC
VGEEVTAPLVDDEMWQSLRQLTVTDRNTDLVIYNIHKYINDTGNKRMKKDLLKKMEAMEKLVHLRNNIVEMMGKNGEAMLAKWVSCFLDIWIIKGKEECVHMPVLK